MESLLNFQSDLSSRIAKARSTFRKSPKERITEYYVQSRLEALEQLWNDFRQGHKELLQTADASLLKPLKYTTDDVYELTEEQYMTYKCELKRILVEFEAQSNVSKPNTSVNENVNKRSTLVKLPKISIPTFSGKYTEWPTFRDLFVSMIHNNTDLDNVQKLQYLKGYLTGEAEQLIRHTPVSDANYVQCWKQLEERYSNKKYISNCILKRLLSQRNITTESASCLKDLMDTSSDCLNALQNIGIDVSSWDLIVIHLLSLKLDAESRKQWELNVASNVSSDALPTFKEFQTFLTNRYRALESIEPKNVYKATTFSSKAASNKGHTKVLHATNTVKLSCEFCGEDHKLCFCRKFANQDYEKKHEFVTKNRICYNCLGSNHGVRFCQKATSCRLCQKKHHSLLHPKGVPTGHLGNSVQPVGEGSGERAADGHSNGGPSQSSNETTPVLTCFSKGQVRNQVLLPTAIVNVESKTGQYRPIRALLDQGSQASFVTEATVQGLGLQKTTANLTISGVGGDQKSMRSKAAVTLKLQSLTDPNFKMELKCYVLTKITSLLPERQLSVPDWIEVKDLCLADKNFDSPNKIDLLLGAEVYSQILKDGVMKGPAGSLVAQCTALGWILSGPMGVARTEHQISVFHAQVEDNEIIKRFWELENEPLLSTLMLTKEEQRCEDIFSATTRRDENGRYVVKLPFRDEELTYKNGNSREIAIKRLKSLERKFIKDKVLKERYTEVIKEYLQLGHMMRVPEEEIVKERSVYLPHHAVVREDKTTTKVRVVFDASCKYENGVSLNDNLMVGPTLQPDLRHLIMSWRKHPVCLIADIVKMYRMVNVAEEDCDFQRIVWRDHPENEIQDYKLLTVTFGTASAPYLAVKSLNQVAIDHKKEYPIASEKVAREFYMDDLMTGCQTIEEGTRLYQEMNALLKKGGFILQKWSSNKDELLQIIDQSGNGEHNKQDKALEFKQDNIVKILGLTWNRSRDEFHYSVKLPPLSAPVTKRKIISDVARLFDPLGWIAPCVIKAKIFIQRLWIAGTGWDEEPPTSILEDWYTYRNELAQLTDFSIPRWMFTRTDDVVTELHGFSDASNVAYSAVVYLRVINVNSEVRVVLVSAKTRVSPVRQVSIPRLELCGAALLTKLLVEVAGVLNIPRNDIRAWTDSSVVLAWLNKHPSHWKTFVANRVSEIHSKLESSQWCHVSTKDNPADCASRGVQPSDLAELELWKFGPKFLWNKNIAYTRLKDNNTNEEQSVKVHLATSEIEVSILDRYSSLQRLIRVVALCRRFVTKKEIVKQSQDVKVLTKWELDEALLTCIKLSQATEFQAEIKEIRTYGQVTSKSSKLLCLTPFIDEKGLLRVNGRITHSQEPRSFKEPIILSHRSHFSDLIVDDAHRKTLHGDARLMLNFIRSAYWIIGVKNLVKGHVHKCVVCVRYKAKLQNQLMGTLPAVRVTPARAFLNSGVDYAGPIMLRTSKGRGHKAYKGYVSLFVCMVTKAVHIEVVSDLTSRGFLEAFKRFVARRGHCANLYSDNGTNFIGASKELKELFDAEKSTMTKEVAECLAVQGTNWHFIPPRAPNFGGLWEAGIKSVKYHVKRVIGESTLTFEEMSTLLSQIEACLNSRPLSVLSNDPTEAVPLTPGHFLVGEPLVTVPEATYENCNISTLKRWQITQEMLQNFWRRWSNEYLTHLMHRYKWAFKTPEPEVGNIVLIKEDDLPPSKWLFGKILAKYPGSDKLTRVVSVKCKNSVIRRPTSKICVLPVSE